MRQLWGLLSNLLSKCLFRNEKEFLYQHCWFFLFLLLRNPYEVINLCFDNNNKKKAEDQFMMFHFLHDALKYWNFFLSLEPYVLEALASFIIQHMLLTETKVEVLQDVSFLSLIMQVCQLLLVPEHLVLPRQVLKFYSGEKFFQSNLLN